jgi:hypothetical protein
MLAPEANGLCRGRTKPFLFSTTIRVSSPSEKLYLNWEFIAAAMGLPLSSLLNPTRMSIRKRQKFSELPGHISIAGDRRFTANGRMRLPRSRFAVGTNLAI